MSEKKKYSELVLEERKKGNVVFLALEEVMSAPVKDIVAQPVDGLLWDLNRDEATALTFMDREGMIHWVNNFAVALVIRELKSQVGQLNTELELYKEAERQIAEFGTCLEWKEENDALREAYKKIQDADSPDLKLPVDMMVAMAEMTALLNKRA